MTSLPNPFDSSVPVCTLDEPAVPNPSQGPGTAADIQESLAKATKGKAGMAVGTAHVRRSTAGTGLRVGEAVAVQPATSEIMDATAGETAPNSKRGRGRPRATGKRPWDAAGMSKSAYYRHQAEQREKAK